MFLLTLSLRWVALGSLGGDDHWSLWTASTFLNGDRPFQEFVDPGDPLYWGMSALAQWLVGYRAIGEVWLGFLLISFAVTQSFRMAWRASGSFFIALGLGVMAAVLVAPTKLYSYPKIFLYPVGIWLAWRYIDRPGIVRACVLALGVAIAFGYRHDHGAYIAVGASAAVLAAHWKNGFKDVAVSLVRVGFATILILSPYFALIQINEGLIPYFKERINFAAEIDAAGRRAVPFVVDPAQPLLYTVPPQAPVFIGVRWAKGLSDETRAAAEVRYGLGPVSPSTKGWYPYTLTDDSEANLAAIFADEHVTTVDGVAGSFRRGFALDEPDGTGGDPGVTVAWAANAAPAQIESAERRYKLRPPLPAPVDASTRPVRYGMGDTSAANVTALREDPLVADVRGIHFTRLPIAIGLRDHVPVGPSVPVHWAESVSPAKQSELEKQFTLLHGRMVPAGLEQSYWVYELGDRTDANVTALATSPWVDRVEDLARGDKRGTFSARAWTAPRGGRVSISWSPALTDEARRALELRYHLEPDSRLPAEMMPYMLLNASPDTIDALVSDPNSVEVTGVNAREHVEGDRWFTALGRRFAILRLVPLPRLFHKANSGVWLYYLSYSLPLGVLALLIWDWWCGRTVPVMPREAQKMFALAVLMAVANFALLRKLGYFPDHFDAAAIMAAWLLGRALRAEWRRPAGAAVRVIALVMVGVSTVAASAYVDLPSFVDKYGLNRPVSTYPEMIAEKFRSFASSPPIDHYAPKDSIGDRAIVRYLFECTQPEDRIFVTSDIYTVPYYTQRRAVGHVFWANGFMANPDFERRMIDLMERDPVPFLFGVGGERALDNLNSYPQVREYVAKRYTEHHAVLQDSLAGKVFWLLVDSRRTPTSRYEKLGLPCFG